MTQPSHESPQTAEVQEPKRQSLEEVLEAGTESLRLSLDLVSGSSLDFESIDEAVSLTSSTIGAERDESVAGTIDLAAPQKTDTHGLAADELEALVSRAERQAAPIAFQDQDDVPALENTSILLHQTFAATDLEAWARKLEICTKGLDPRGVAALILDATRDTCEHLAHADFDHWMTPLVPLLRRTVPNLCEHLAGFAVVASPHGRAALWPFLVDEFLVTLKGRVQGLDPRVHELDAVALEAAIGRLCQLPAIQRPRITPGMFALEQTFIHPLLLRLMQSPARHAIGPVILGAFRQSLPVDPGISFCVFAMRQYEESLGWLLAAQLESPQSTAHPDMQRSAAWLLVSVMDAMSAERRSELWVAGAIEWLGERDQTSDNDAQREGTLGFLHRVTKERAGIRKAWSRDCRRAARAAIERSERS